MRIVKVVDLTFHIDHEAEAEIELALQAATPPSGVRPEIVSCQVIRTSQDPLRVLAFLVLDGSDLESINYELPIREPAERGGSRAKGPLY